VQAQLLYLCCSTTSQCHSSIWRRLQLQQQQQQQQEWELLLQTAMTATALLLTSLVSNQLLLALSAAEAALLLCLVLHFQACGSQWKVSAVAWASTSMSLHASGTS
jgi:hypothetical protein